MIHADEGELDDLNTHARQAVMEQVHCITVLMVLQLQGYRHPAGFVAKPHIFSLADALKSLARKYCPEVLPDDGETP